MSIESRFIHTLTIERMVAGGNPASVIVRTVRIGAGLFGAIKTITVTASGGTFDLLLLEWCPVTNIPYDATAAELQSLIDAAWTYGAYLRVISRLGDVFTVEFVYDGDAFQVDPPLTADGANLTGGTVSARGHAARVWAELATVQGLVQERSGREVAGPDLQPIVSDALIFLAAGTDVTERDRIVLGTTTYELLYVKDAGGVGHHLEIDARRVTP
jgi:head-tail adaptor